MTCCGHITDLETVSGFMFKKFKKVKVQSF